ncbi:cache domain-containing sensor histidine kinase [Paenibacillus graminis]|uniref:cache domain-containing sensor histidine kinase n=1 Tax=Paenibacillus graminis TaxID=189425 RepID=UPI00138E1E68|nr:histidine kinase [Paenibacillus graminis]
MISIIKFKDLSLKLKLYLCIALFVLLPLILMGFYLNYQFAELNEKKTYDTVLETLKQTRQNFDSIITDTDDKSKRIVANQLIQDFANGKYSKKKDYDKIYWDINNWLDEILGSRQNYKSISLYSTQEVIFEKGMQVSELDPSVMERALSLKGKGFWVTSSGEIEYYRGIMDLNKYGKMIGIERFNLDEEKIYQFFKGVKSYDNAHIYLLDSKGIILSSTDRGEIGSNFKKLVPIQKGFSQEEGFVKTLFDERANVAFFYTINETNWRLIQVIPETSFSMLRRTINLILLITILLCVSFGLLFSFVQHKYLLRPLQKLRREMMKLKSGNFNIQLEVDSKDEIGEISNGFMRTVTQLKETIDDVYIGKIKQREAELKALEAQINPHFLYNTLDSIHWLALKEKNYEVSEQIEALAEIFRHVLNKGESFITIRQEISFLENYMFIQKRKYGKRIKLNINVDQVLMDCKMPKLVLQPLVENAIVHGLEPIVEGGNIEVSITRVPQGVLFTVSDNGTGTDESRIHQMMTDQKEAKNVFALKNIDERIKINYGPEYGLHFTSTYQVGTQVKVYIPMIK